jgi:hypothetical protein
MTPQINLIIAAERRADTRRAAAAARDRSTSSRLARPRLGRAWLRLGPAAQPLACCV